MTLYLYDPRINTLTETTYDYLEELTGKSQTVLRTNKSIKRKVTSINCYITDQKVTLRQRKAWYEKEKFFNETWKPIEGSDGKFLISNYGRFKRIYQNHEGLLLPFIHKRTGNLHIKVKFRGKYAAYKVANLVAHHFVGKPKPGEVLHHKNFIKTDNFHGNLEYITSKKLGEKTGSRAKSKPVVQLNSITNEVIDEYRSARDAGRKCHISYQSVIDNCNHKTKSSCGLHFMWAEEYEVLEEALLT
ncbi:NUMOD4 domain-containing protein [Fictibacillus aquaticus]|uniref:Uncharacterized protein n=1 Tax=Fictibacillus aquaticus TaxID=2021314 RepID=A0A235FA13_9BACL|nr:NUMOD4 domain-containing protein [Fictibacillus aquaticus]OYD57884.1 hypothetical protein CGZ90_08260 [Fictibacillus aquaticus]